MLQKQNIKSYLLKVLREYENILIITYLQKKKSHDPWIQLNFLINFVSIEKIASITKSRDKYSVWKNHKSLLIHFYKSIHPVVIYEYYLICIFMKMHDFFK